MQVIHAADGTTKRGTTFTGETWQTDLLPKQEPEGTRVGVVRFVNGSRTHWHTHPGEQVLYILAGEGRAGTETEEWAVFPGDVIYAPRGERHWHGAAAGKDMTHLTVTTVDPPEWFGPPDGD